LNLFASLRDVMGQYRKWDKDFMAVAKSVGMPASRLMPRKQVAVALMDPPENESELHLSLYLEIIGWRVLPLEFPSKDHASLIVVNEDLLEIVINQKLPVYEDADLLILTRNHLDRERIGHHRCWYLRKPFTLEDIERVCPSPACRMGY
jgi:hypothetical protein